MTSGQELDTRVVRSRKALKAALLKLLADKPFTRIKTSEIAKLAQINRVTFYDHYASKEELLEEVIDDVLTEYADIIESLPGQTAAHATPDYLYKTIRSSVRHVKKHADFYRIMLLTNGVPDLSNKLHDQMSASLRKSFRQAGSEHAEVEYELFIDWIIGGAIGIYKYWLQNGLRHSEEEIARQMLIITTASGQVFNPKRIITME